MTAKDYLMSYRKKMARWKILQAEVDRLRTDAEGMRINLDGMPRASGNKDRTERLAIQLADYEMRLTQEASELYMQSMKIVAELGQLQNHKHQEILYKRYIKGITWEQIAVDMDITWRHCHRLHKLALMEFEKIIQINS